MRSWDSEFGVYPLRLSAAPKTFQKISVISLFMLSYAPDSLVPWCRGTAETFFFISKEAFNATRRQEQLLEQAKAPGRAH